MNCVGWRSQGAVTCYIMESQMEKHRKEYGKPNGNRTKHYSCLSWFRDPPDKKDDKEIIAVPPPPRIMQVLFQNI